MSQYTVLESYLRQLKLPTFAHPSDLSLANHVHDLISLQRSPCRFYGKEAHPWFDQTFDEPMVLLDQVIQVFDLPQFDTLGKDSSRFELGNGFGIGGMLIDIDDARSGRSGVRISRSSRLGSLLLARTRPRS